MKKKIMRMVEEITWWNLIVGVLILFVSAIPESYILLNIAFIMIAISGVGTTIMLISSFLNDEES